ncbi:MAG: hypothetical protein ACI8PG_003975 [Planctomycetota bacterium]|jgi:hypothetical protein
MNPVMEPIPLPGWSILYLDLGYPTRYLQFLVIKYPNFFCFNPLRLLLLAPLRRWCAKEVDAMHEI